MNVERVKAFLVNIPLHVVIIVLVIAWLTPTFGMFVTSFRTPQAISQSGWWTVFRPTPCRARRNSGRVCASCHGVDGTAVKQANLTDPKVVRRVCERDPICYSARRGRLASDRCQIANCRR